MKPTFIQSVRLRAEPCCLKRHFRGCARQVISYLDRLAANDPERFVWPSVPNITQNARKWKTGRLGRSSYGKRAVQYSLRQLERLRILIPTRQQRNGRLHAGWVVAEHWSDNTFGVCQFILKFPDLQKDAGEPAAHHSSCDSAPPKAQLCAPLCTPLCQSGVALPPNASTTADQSIAEVSWEVLPKTFCTQNLERIEPLKANTYTLLSDISRDNSLPSSNSGYPTFPIKEDWQRWKTFCKNFPGGSDQAFELSYRDYQNKAQKRRDKNVMRREEFRVHLGTEE